jgi:hypothetical protein
MGDLLITDKEATGLVIGGLGPNVPRPRWAAVGKVCSPRKLIIGALERALERAWGLNGPAQFKDIGDNRFVARFNSEGDWKHAMFNGPWQFDFNVVLLKEFNGSIRPSDMVFDTMDIWVRVLDLPMDMMNGAYGKLFGGWIGKFISVDVDDDGMAWGEDLRIRVAIRVDQPLLRGISVRESENDEACTWFDLRYEKVPHFCFDYGRVVHPENRCTAEVEEGKQWGEWLRAEPTKQKKSGQVSRPSGTSGSFCSRSFEAEPSFKGHGVSIRDIPPRRSFRRDFSYSSSSRTGGDEARVVDGDTSSSAKRHQERDTGPSMVDRDARSPQKKNNGRGGTYVRRPRATGGSVNLQVPPGIQSRKRGTRQVWLPVPVRVLEEEITESTGKRQKTNSVFDRLEDPNNVSAAPARRGRRDQ